MEQLNKVPDVTHTLVFSAEVACKLGEEINCKLYSSLGKLLCVTAYVLRFVCMLRKCDTFKSNNGIELSIHELKNAEAYWVQYLQAEAF